MKQCYYSMFLLLLCATSLQSIEQLAIVIIIDQCTHKALQQITPHAQGGIKDLLKTGIIYDHAYFPYARTSTGPGHATLNTGALPRDHGIIANYWYDIEGKKIPCDYDNAEKAAIIAPKGFYKKSKSAQHAKADGISDQLMLSSTKDKKNYAYALSLKSRAAIFAAGRLGKAIFFDSRAGSFTSTRAYFKALPDWLKKFNETKKYQTIESLPWKLAYPKNNEAYAMTNTQYSAARIPSVINKELSYDFLKQDAHKNHHPYNFITYSPQSNKMLFELSEEFLKTILQENPHKVLLWISLSSLDKIGHLYGPDSREYIDTLYHIDHYLKEFMNNVKEMVPEEKIVYALTGDHGCTPMVEYLQEKKFDLAHRILTEPLERKINKKIEKKYGISNCIKEIDNPSIFLDNSQLKKLSLSTKKNLLFDIKHFLKKEKGIKDVWTHEELEKIATGHDNFTLYYKNQLFPGRTGSLLYQTYPYTFVSDDPLGTGHVSCYNYTTHVPLIFYKPGRTKPKTMRQKIPMTRFAPTLAAELAIPAPSCCLESSLDV